MRADVGSDGVFVEKYDVGVWLTWRDIQELERIRKCKLREG